MDFTQRIIKNGTSETKGFRLEYTAECQADGTASRLVAQVKRTATEDTKEVYAGFALMERASGRFQLQLTAPTTPEERQALLTEFETAIGELM